MGGQAGVGVWVGGHGKGLTLKETVRAVPGPASREVSAIALCLHHRAPSTHCEYIESQAGAGERSRKSWHLLQDIDRPSHRW